jgi:hypothetical protein
MRASIFCRPQNLRKPGYGLPLFASYCVLNTFHLAGHLIFENVKKKLEPQPQTKDWMYFGLYPLVLLNIPGIRISFHVPPDPVRITKCSEQCLSDPLYSYSYHYWCLAWFLRRTLYLSTFMYSVVSHSLYWPGQAVRDPGREAPRISRQLAH